MAVRATEISRGIIKSYVLQFEEELPNHHKQVRQLMQICIVEEIIAEYF